MTFRPRAALVLTALAFAAVVAAVPASAEGPAVPVVGNPVPKPGAADEFVIFNDGRILAGPTSADEANGTVTVVADGKPQTFPTAEVSFAFGTKDDKRKRLHKGDDTGIYAAWAKWLDAEFLAKRGGAKFTAAESGPRDAYRDGVIAAIQRCSEKKWKAYTAAGSLVADAIDRGVWDETFSEAALAACPDSTLKEGFPFNSAPEERVRLWAKWSKALVPLGGQFVNPEQHEQANKINAEWKKNAIILRARNVELWSRERENVKVVADVLNQGEATVRALESLLGKPETGGDEPLMVRLSENRQAYLQDPGPNGAPPQDSVGVFSPGDGISRFYVDKDGAELRATVSHELTHHWLERRRFRGASRRGTTPGHWIIEGFAQFVEDQSPLFQKGKFGFAEERVESIQRCRKGSPFPIADYVNITAQDFNNKLTSDPKRIRMFYDQGGALSFYMVHKRGEDGRKKLVEYMRKQYAGEFLDAGPEDPYGNRKVDWDKAKPILDSWTVLGFKSAEELDAAFTGWLRSAGK